MCPSPSGEIRYEKAEGLLGGGVSAALLSAVALALWVAAPLEGARRLLAGRDL